MTDRASGDDGLACCGAHPDDADATPNDDLRELIEKWRGRINDAKRPGKYGAVITDDKLAGASSVILDLESVIKGDNDD